MKEIVNLLDEVTQLLKLQQHIKQQEVERVLTVAKPIVEETKKKIKENASNFNVFSALGVTRRETIQSTFLAYLLNPEEQHEQGTLFLNKFLEKIDISAITLEIVKITPEYYVGDYGRMDIVIECQQADWLVAIENKIDAGEGDNQLKRYANWLKEQKYKLKKLIFLTPTGHEAVTAIKDSYRQFSYLELVEIFESSLDTITTKAVRVVLEQYIINLKLIGGIIVTENKELLELLLNPENIKTVLEIEQQAQFIRVNIAKEFGENIHKMLQIKLESENLEKNWKADSGILDNKVLYVEIRTLQHQAKANYRMLAQGLFHYQRNQGWFGWYRPAWIDLKTILDTKDLTNKMICNGSGKPESWWIGWKYLRQGKKGFVITDSDDIITCLTDNKNEKHPLANEIANELWEMFTKYRTDIEALPSFIQAALL